MNYTSTILLNTYTMGSWTNLLRAVLKHMPHRMSLLAIDLDGDGIISPSGEVYFDANNDSFLEKTSWINSGDGLLAWDLNYNGRIDNVAELFSSDSIPAAIKLSLLDVNADGILDRTDYAFNKLLLWRDENSNGYSEPHELQTLRKYNISAISLEDVSFTYANGTAYKSLMSNHTVDVMDSWYNPKSDAIAQAVLQKDLHLFASISPNSTPDSAEAIDSYIETVEYKLTREIQRISSHVKIAASHRAPCQTQSNSYPDETKEAEAALAESLANSRKANNIRYIERYTLASKNLEQEFQQRLIKVYAETEALSKANKWDQLTYEKMLEQSTTQLQAEHKVQAAALATQHSKAIAAENAEVTRLHQEAITNISQLLREGIVPEIVEILRQNDHTHWHLCIQQQKAIVNIIHDQEQERTQGIANYLANLKSVLQGADLGFDDSIAVVIRGYGKMPALGIAMAEDPILKQMVDNFSAPPMLDKVTAIMCRWANIHQLDPDAQTFTIGAVIEARKVAFIERFTGYAFKQLGIAMDTGEEAAIAIEEAWTIAVTRIMKTLLILGPLRLIFPNVQYLINSDTLSPEPNLDDYIKVISSPPNHSIFYTKSPTAVMVNLPDQLLHLGGSNYNDTLIGNDLANYINGEGGDDDIHGGGDNDTLFGAGGRNNLFGDEGDDIFITSPGADYMDGGAGNDTVSYHHSFAAVGVHVDLMKGSGTGGHAHGDRYINIENIKGSRFEDLLRGDNHKNTIYGMEGDDEVYGFDGDDKIIPGTGADTCDGGEGIDTISYESSSFGATINIASGIAHCGPDGDKFSGFENAIGTNSTDEITGDSLDNKLFGLSGDDTITGGGGNDVLSGGPGNNKLIGGAGNDRFIIGEGSNIVTGGEGHNMVDYTNAKTAVFIDLHQQQAHKEHGEYDFLENIQGVIGSPYNDRIIGNVNNRPIYYGGDGDDYIEGDSWNDEMHGGTGYNTMIGGGGNDRFFAGIGVNSMDGGDGDDTVSYIEYRAAEYHDTVEKELEMRTRDDLLPSYPGQLLTMPEVLDKSGLTIDLPSGASNKLDQFTNMEIVVGSHYNDLIIGDTHNNTLIGSNGDDTIYGGSGDDKIECGRGISKLYGEDGNDNFTLSIGAAHLYGGSGYDTLDLILYPNGVSIHIRDNYITYGDLQSYDLLDIEAIRSTNHPDIIHDDAGDNEIHASGGNDTIHLTDGNDAASGDDGDDTIYLDGGGRKLVWGGTGRDTFVLTPKFNCVNRDDTIIVDFKNDILDLRLFPHIHNMQDLKVEQYYNNGLLYTAITIDTNQTISLFAVEELGPDDIIFCP